MSAVAKRRIFYEIVVLVVLFVILIITTIGDWLLVVDNEKIANESELLYQQLLEDEVALESEVNKLMDEEYLARHAREKFFYSKDGELIIRIPEVGE